MAKAPSLWKDGTKGTQRTRKLSTGNALWSWRKWISMENDQRCCAVCGESRMHGAQRGDEETYRKATRLSLPNGNVGILPNGSPRARRVSPLMSSHPP